MRAGEHLSIARRRVVASLLRDVAFWFFLLALLVVFVRYLNSDVALSYVEDKWIVSEPSSHTLPASSGSSALLPLAVLTGVCVVVLGIRHGIGLNGRISFGLTASLLMGIGGLAMVVCACMKVPAFMAAAKADFLEGPFWRPFWGPGFGVWLICSLAFGAQAEARKWGSSRVPFCLAVAGNASGLLFFSPPIVSTVFLLVSAFVAVFCLAYLGRAGSMGASARNLVLMLMGFATPFFFISALLPDEIEFDDCIMTNGTVKEAVKRPVQEIYSVKGGGFLAVDKEQKEVYRKLSPALSDIAKTVWKEHPWYGAGIGAFSLHVPMLLYGRMKMSKDQLDFFQRQKDDWRTLVLSQQKKDAVKKARVRKNAPAEFNWRALRPCNRNPVCAFNSYWTFLAEHGILGMSLVVLGLGILFFTYFYRLVKSVLYLRSQDDADIVAFASPPITWVVPFAVILLLVLAVYAPIFEIAPMMLVCAVPLAVAAASFPKQPSLRPKYAKPLEKESP